MPSFNYKAAKDAGYSDDDIAKYLQEQNNSGADLYIDKKEYETATAPAEAPQEPGVLDKTAGVVDKTLGKVADFTFGNTAKLVGGTGIRVGEAIAANTPQVKELEKSNQNLQDIDMRAIQRARELAKEGRNDQAEKLLDIVRKHGRPITIEEILSAPSKSSVKQVAGEALGAAAELAPFAKVGKAANLVSKVGERVMTGPASGVTKKALAAEGAAYGGAMGAGQALQEEDSTAGDVAKSTVIGAGAGAALALTVAALVPYVVKGAGKTAKGIYKAFNPEAEDALFKAISPKKSNVFFKDNLKTALPDIYETAQLSGRDISKSEDPIGDLAKTIAESKRRVWSTYEDLKGPNAKIEIDGNPVADAMVASMDDRFKRQNPAKAARIEEIANSYRRPMTVDEAESALQSANNDLHSYYAKNKVGRKVAAMDPDTGHIVQEADALRNELYKKLNELTGEDAAGLKRRYGALSNIQEEVAGRANVAARQSDQTTAQQINTVSGVGDIVQSLGDAEPVTAAKGVAKIAVGNKLREMRTPEYQIKKAFAKMEKKPPELYPKPANKYNRAITKAGQQPETLALPAPSRADLIKAKSENMKKSQVIALPERTLSSELKKSNEGTRVLEPVKTTGKDVKTGKFKAVYTSVGKGTPEAKAQADLIQKNKKPDTVVYRTEKAHKVYKGKSVWGDGLYTGIDKNQVADMTLDPNSSIVRKPNTGSVKKFSIPSGAKIKTIDLDNMSTAEFNQMKRGNELKKQILAEGYDGAKILTGGDLNLGGDQIVIYNKKIIDKINSKGGEAAFGLLPAGSLAIFRGKDNDLKQKEKAMSKELRSYLTSSLFKAEANDKLNQMISDKEYSKARDFVRQQLTKITSQTRSTPGSSEYYQNLLNKFNKRFAPKERSL